MPYLALDVRHLLRAHLQPPLLLSGGRRRGRQPLADARVPLAVAFVPIPPAASAAAAGQGLKIIHFLGQRERFLWDRGCV
jgi:hypothetical protein